MERGVITVLAFLVCLILTWVDVSRGYQHVYPILLNAIQMYEQLSNTKQVVVRINDEDDSVILRLVQEGFLGSTALSNYNLEEALMLFQQSHFISQTGELNLSTVKKMNIAYNRKLKWLKRSIEVVSKIPFELLGRQFIWVNIPTFSLEYYVDGYLVSKHKVIVGKEAGRKIVINGWKVGINNTLPLVSEIKHVVVNPRWYVPERIQREMCGRGGCSGRFHFHSSGSVYQMPGGRNPLGKVKFLFDNPFGFYLHDTPEKHLFNRTSRMFSHGCIRVENALDLAKIILERNSPTHSSKIKKYLKRSDQTYITLDVPIPIVITYMPVYVSEEGMLEFGGDPYGWEQNNNGLMPDFFYVSLLTSQ